MMYDFFFKYRFFIEITTNKTLRQIVSTTVTMWSGGTLKAKTNKSLLKKHVRYPNGRMFGHVRFPWEFDGTIVMIISGNKQYTFHATSMIPCTLTEFWLESTSSAIISTKIIGFVYLLWNRGEITIESKMRHLLIDKD